MNSEERDKYWRIFQGLEPKNGYLDQGKAVQVLKSSRLPDSQLEKLWDLGDIDDDGTLDFDEFCVVMKIAFRLINHELSEVPKHIPEELVPASKRHLVAARNALAGEDNMKSLVQEVVDADADPDDDELRDGFEWYMSPSERAQYTQRYTECCDVHGRCTFDSLADRYPNTRVPGVCVRRAWRMVNPKNGQTIDKDQCLVFLHILEKRVLGYRIPHQMPANLKASLRHDHIDYRVEHANTKSINDQGAASQSRDAGKDRSSYSTTPEHTSDRDWELVVLKRELDTYTKRVAQEEEALFESEKQVRELQREKSLLEKAQKIAPLDQQTRHHLEGSLASLEKCAEMLEQLLRRCSAK
ncbi:actin cortical patch component End3 [Schizosaccharomyces japonicus yFS275]|uniref:Actin cortical patch component End3 n=1 Tax=Schizosaccharomyces japonicus (strain yFS275 / FY16936) TaxID=402676 RepID=B6K4B1_SCHJY|nr:actin cortical patch component End3 [Schizosaccharomyces japonicus yFS275]EEB08318.1 actin cortical patch component End3 [Schizosaccharomyces japonicus yFS275]